MMVNHLLFYMWITVKEKGRNEEGPKGMLMRED